MLVPGSPYYELNATIATEPLIDYRWPSSDHNGIGHHILESCHVMVKCLCIGLLVVNDLFLVIDLLALAVYK